MRRGGCKVPFIYLGLRLFLWLRRGWPLCREKTNCGFPPTSLPSDGISKEETRRDTTFLCSDLMARHRRENERIFKLKEQRKI